jgi:hypothetical protein
MQILRSVRQSFVVGLAAGTAVGMLLPKEGRGAIRSVVKGAMKAAMAALRTGHEGLAHAREALQDLAAEARTEHAANNTNGDGATSSRKT